MSLRESYRCNLKQWTSLQLAAQRTKWRIGTVICLCGQTYTINTLKKAIEPLNCYKIGWQKLILNIKVLGLWLCNYYGKVNKIGIICEKIERKKKLNQCNRLSNVLLSRKFLKSNFLENNLQQ